MTPEEERDLLFSARAGIEQALREAHDDALARIANGEDAAIAFRQEYDDAVLAALAILAIAASKITGSNVSSDDVSLWPVGVVSLWAVVSAEIEAASKQAQSVAQRYIKGIHQAREILARISEYKLREVEIVNPLRHRNSLPRELSHDVMSDKRIADDLVSIFDRLVNAIKENAGTVAAAAAVLAVIDSAANPTVSQWVIARLWTSVYDKTRYVISRLSFTELHRLFIAGVMRALSATPLTWVRMHRWSDEDAPPCYCDIYTKTDRYGLGPGVYPVVEAYFPPYHPNCLCWVEQRPDLNGKAPPSVAVPEADRRVLLSLGKDRAARAMGSAAKRDRVLAGEDAHAVINEGRPLQYRVRMLGDHALWVR